MLYVLRLKKVSTDEESDKKLFLLESKLIKKKIYTLVFKTKFLLNLFNHHRSYGLHMRTRRFIK